MGKKSYKKRLAVRSADRPASLYRTKIESISDPESVKTSACSPLVGGNGLAPASPTHPASHPHFNHGWKNVSHTGCTSRYAASQHILSAIPCHSNMVLLLRISIPIFPGNLSIYYPKWMQSNTFNYSITYSHCWKIVKAGL